jgi:uroporphyrinogen-III synthase
MTRPVAVLRPEPGNARTAAAVEAAGLFAIRLPLFEVRALGWPPPDPAGFDALMLTSANAVRCGGPGLAAFTALPDFAVGSATAEAARAAGFSVVETGGSDGAALVARAAERGVARALLLGGRERRLDAGGPIAEAIPVYASEPLPIDARTLAAIEGSVALLHSPNAARRLDTLAGTLDRATVRIAALSPAVAAAAGGGWARVEAVPAPDDSALVALACRLAD